jgi:pimeloyl-ACP methyl ester carboxylesterase
MPSVSSQGVEIAYEVHGEGPTVLVMVGWGTYAHGAFDQVPWAVAAGRRVVLMDWRGLGDSGDDPAIPPTTRAHAIDAAAVLEAVGGEPAHVVGIVGIGACVAQWLAVDRPDLVRSLTLSGGWAGPDRLFIDQMNTLLDVARVQGFAAFRRLSSQWCFDPDYYNAHAESFLGPHGPWSHLDGNLEGMARLVTATIDHEARSALPTVTVPTFVVHATHDLLTGPRLTEPLQELIPGADGMHLPLPHVVAGRDAKRLFSDTLGAWLTRVEANRTSA